MTAKITPVNVTAEHSCSSGMREGICTIAKEETMAFHRSIACSSKGSLLHEM